LQFLIHPIGPLSRHVRDELATAVAEQPGLGGGKWRDALTRIESRMREKFGAEEREIARTQAEISEWLGDERFDPAIGAPIAALARRAQLCSTYLVRQLNALDDTTERICSPAALGQSEALLRALRVLDAQGQLLVKRVDVDRLIDEVASVATGSPTRSRRRDHVRAARIQPRCCRRAGRSTGGIWRRPRATSCYPWSRKEVTWLREHGVALFDIDDVLRNRTRRGCGRSSTRAID
jgi:hypothetical protein